MIEHNFKKKFGQNFISDKNLLDAICLDAGIDEKDDVLEIGAGGGSLTKALDEHAKKVVSYEIDKDLQDHLLSLNLKNTNFVFGDIMDFDLEEIEKDFEGGYKLVANLPYYITSPIIFKFLKSNKLTSLTIMVQKEVAERIVASEGGKDYGLLSVMTGFYGKSEINRIVSKKMFYPQPNVDSAIVTIKKHNAYENINEDKFYKLISCSFAMRRKTLKNNLIHGGFTLEKLKKIGEEKLKMRPEQLSIKEFIEIYLKIFNVDNNILL